MNDTAQMPRITATPPAPDYKGAFDALIARLVNRIASRVGDRAALLKTLRPLWTGGILSEMAIRTLFLVPMNDKIRAALADVKAQDDGKHQDTVGDAAARLLLILCEESVRGTSQNGVMRDGRPNPCVVAVATLLQSNADGKEARIEEQVDNLLMQWSDYLSAASRSGRNARHGYGISDTLIRLFNLVGNLRDYAGDPKRHKQARFAPGGNGSSAQSTTATATPTRREARASFNVDINTSGCVEYASRTFPRNHYGELIMSVDDTREFLRLLAQLEWLKRREDEGYDEDDEGGDIEDAIDDAEDRCVRFLKQYERDHYWDAADCDDGDSDDDWDAYDSNTDDEVFESSDTDFDEAIDFIRRTFQGEIDALVREREANQ